MKIQNASDFGSAIRAARRTRGLTQQQLADFSGVGITFVSNLERGKPTSEIGKAICVALTAGLDIFAEDRRRHE